MTNEVFDNYFRNWVKWTCADWHIEEPEEDYYSKVYNRLGEEIQTAVVIGINEGLVIPNQTTFKVKEQLASRTPYHWFSRNREPKPCPNWEYFVQLAEFSRLSRLLKDRSDYRVLFQDGTVDISVYKNKKLYVLTETKETASQIKDLIREVKQYEDSIDYTISDKANDSLRKAKYIVERRPQFFSLVAIGGRSEYKVTYPEGKEFALVESSVRWD